jgi:hypothetical protein
MARTLRIRPPWRTVSLVQRFTASPFHWRHSACWRHSMDRRSNRPPLRPRCPRPRYLLTATPRAHLPPASFAGNHPHKPAAISNPIAATERKTSIPTRKQTVFPGHRSGVSGASCLTASWNRMNDHERSIAAQKKGRTYCFLFLSFGPSENSSQPSTINPIATPVIASQVPNLSIYLCPFRRT